MVHYRVGNIDTSPLVTIPVHATIQDAVESMISSGQAQLGVVKDGNVEGIVTHRSITRLLLILTQSGDANSLLDRQVSLAMEEPTPVVDETDDIFTLFSELAESPYVLIDRGDEYHVLRDVGFHQYLRGELDMFIIIEEIERTIRELLVDAFGERLSDQLVDTFEPMDIPTPESVEECSFGHYHIFISSHWESFETYFDDDKAFVRDLLEKVGDVRNNLFHFRSGEKDGMVEREFISFVKDYLDNGRER